MTKRRQFNSVTTLATSASILPEALYPDPARSTRPSSTTTAHITKSGSLSSLILNREEKHYRSTFWREEKKVKEKT